MSESNAAVSNIQITSEVISSIAAAAALDVEGVAGLETTKDGGLLGFFFKKDIINGVEVKTEGGEVSLSMKAVAYFGYRLSELGAEVQKRVKEAVESMAGTKVKKVDVSIVGIEKEPEPSSEYEKMGREVTD